MHRRPPDVLRADRDPRGSLRPDLSNVQLIDAWDRAADNAQRPMTPEDLDIFLEARSRCAVARDLYGWGTVPIPRAGPANLRRLIGILATPEVDDLALVIDLEDCAAEAGRSRRSIVRDLKELEARGRITRLPLWAGAPGSDRQRATSAIVLHPLECEWDRCPRIFMRAVYAPLVAAVYSASFGPVPWVTLDGARIGRSQRTFWRYVSHLEDLGMLQVDRQEGRRNVYRAGPALLAWSWEAERKLRVDHRTREWRAQRERVRVPHPLRSDRSWINLRESTCSSSECVSVTPLEEIKRNFRNSSRILRSGRDPPGADGQFAAPARRERLAFKTGRPAKPPDLADALDRLQRDHTPEAPARAVTPGERPALHRAYSPALVERLAKHPRTRELAQLMLESMM